MCEGSFRRCYHTPLKLSKNVQLTADILVRYSRNVAACPVFAFLFLFFFFSKSSTEKLFFFHSCIYLLILLLFSFMRSSSLLINKVIERRNSMHYKVYETRHVYIFGSSIISDAMIIL